jgi:2-polyprenyl-3-methyl-5-hydroxy-6-metoxy-1,4-benzoquinol methylase
VGFGTRRRLASGPSLKYRDGVASHSASRARTQDEALAVPSREDEDAAIGVEDRRNTRSLFWRRTTWHRDFEASRLIPEQQRWNHNIHYFSVLLGAIGSEVESALDVGCGDGMLARRLGTVANHVLGIDVNAEQIELAKIETSAAGQSNIHYVLRDVLVHQFDGTFEVVCSVATLHHLGTEKGLVALAKLVKPGGLLLIEGLARSTTPLDFAYDAVGSVLTQVLKRTGGRRYYEHSAPIVWPPKDSFRDLSNKAAQLLPGVRYQRHPLWRYTLIWRKP